VVSVIAGLLNGDGAAGQGDDPGEEAGPGYNEYDQLDRDGTSRRAVDDERPQQEVQARGLLAAIGQVRCRDKGR